MLHTRTHTGKRPYPSNLCEKKFSNKAALAQHERSVAVESEESHYGNLYYITEFTDPGNVHFPSTTGATITINSECEPLATTNDDYIYYIKEEPEEPTEDVDEEEFVCERVFSDDMHTITKYEEDDNQPEDSKSPLASRLVSPVCRVVAFKRERVAGQPVILVGRGQEHDYDRELPRTRVVTAAAHAHSLAPPGETVCELCGKSYGSTRAMKIHMKRHVSLPHQQRSRKPNTNEVVCDLCGKKYKSNAALRYHTRVHTGEKPYQCIYCPKAFTMPLFLQLHTRTHTGERPYPCNLCEKKFSNKAALARHERVHTGEKPYECQFCGKSFTQSNSMKLHITTVHLKLPSPYKSHSRAARQQKRLEAMQASGRAPRQKVVRMAIYDMPPKEEEEEVIEEQEEYYYEH